MVVPEGKQALFVEIEMSRKAIERIKHFLEESLSVCSMTPIRLR